MIPIGYKSKRVSKRPEWLKNKVVEDIYSVSVCVSEDFDNWVDYWRHNGFWFFDSPDIIKAVAAEHQQCLHATALFYYEAYEKQFSDSEKNGSLFP